LRTIIIENYNPKWAVEFSKLEKIYLSKIRNLNIDIQHIGSTSVVGLSAKPIIDIDIIVECDSDKKKVIEILSELSYKHLGDLGISGREAFRLENNEKIKTAFKHNLYVCTKNCISLKNHLCFREYLRNTPKSIEQYSKLKRKLAKKFPHDIDAYVEGKTDFITKILVSSGIDSKDLLDIVEQNKQKSLL